MDGSIKRMTKSETYAVDEVKEFAANLGRVLCHFKLSGKGTSLLNGEPGVYTYLFMLICYII